MEELLLTKIPVVATLTAVFFLLTAAQTLHALFLAARKNARPVSAASVYEALLVVHLYLATATMLSAYANHGTLLLHLRVTALPLSALLWFNLALAVMGLALAIRYRKPVMTWEIALFAACSPPVIDAAGAFAPYLFIADAAFLTFRVSAGLILDIRRFRNSITRLSAIEAVDRLPEGLAMADRGGRVLYMNDAMRWCLMELGFATDLSDVSMLWENLREIAERGTAPINGVLPEGVRIQVGEGNVRLFKRDTAEVNGKTYRRLTAIDVTEEERLNITIARTNGLLEQANRELEESLAGVREVARNEAMLHMKARVHDTIGQRLSILHRYLEDGSNNPEALDQVTELVRNMMEDLGRTGDEQSPTELASIVHAFELVGGAPRADRPPTRGARRCRGACHHLPRSCNQRRQARAGPQRAHRLRGKRQLVHAACNQRWLSGSQRFPRGNGASQHARGRWRGRRHLPGDGNPAFHARSGGSTVE